MTTPPPNEAQEAATSTTSHEAPEITMRDRANSALSDAVMSDPVDSPDTDPSDYSPSPSTSTPGEGRNRSASTEVDDGSFHSTTSIIEKAVANSPLFRLPHELRQKIYWHALHTDYTILWPSDHCSVGLQVQLLRTCKAVLHEAAPLLYASNTLHFQHPSDCNMFLWAHDPTLGRLVTRMIIQARDRDVRSLWSPYLGSTNIHRSLMHDFPHLEKLRIQLKSSFFLMMPGNLEDRFRNWHDDSNLKNLCQALKERTPEDCDVRVIVHTRCSGRDVQELLSAFPDELSVGYGGPDESIMVRSQWRQYHRARQALELEGTPMERVTGP